MITVKQVLEQYDISSNDSKNLAALVHAGLLEESKLPILNRALSKSAVMMTEAEKKSLQAIVESLASCVISEQQDYLSKMDTSRPMGYPSEKDIPTVLILKRKAIRVYPDNQKVALYYCQALNRYISVPYGKNAKNLGMVMNESSTLEDRIKRLSVGRPTITNGGRLTQGGSVRLTAKRVATIAAKSGEDAGAAVKAMKNISGATGSGVGSRAQQAAFELRAKIGQSDFVPKTEKYKPIGGKQSTPKVPQGPTQFGLKPIAESFKQKLAKKRQEKLDEVSWQDAKNFTYDDLEDNSWTSLGKDLTPGIGTARELERTKRAYREGSYGKAAFHGALTGLSGVSDAALASGVGSGVGAAGKAVIGGIKSGVKLLSKGLTKKTAAKTAETTAAKEAEKAAAKTAEKEAAAATKGGTEAAKATKYNRLTRLARGVAGAVGAMSDTDGEKINRELTPNYQFGLQAKTGGPGQRVTSDTPAARAAVTSFGGDPYRKQQNESNNLNIMKQIVENNISSHTIYLNETPITINNRVAKKVVTVYESLNRQNKKKVEKMLNEDALSFKKVINFAVRQ